MIFRSTRHRVRLSLSLNNSRFDYVYDDVIDKWLDAMHREEIWRRNGERGREEDTK